MCSPPQRLTLRRAGGRWRADTECLLPKLHPHQRVMLNPYIGTTVPTVPDLPTQPNALAVRSRDSFAAAPASLTFFPLTNEAQVVWNRDRNAQSAACGSSGCDPKHRERAGPQPPTAAPPRPHPPAALTTIPSRTTAILGSRRRRQSRGWKGISSGQRRSRRSSASIP